MNASSTTIANRGGRLHEHRHSRPRPAGTAALLLVLWAAGCGAVPGADLAPDAVLGRYDWQRPASQQRLPNALEEISGLEWTPSGHLLGHDDNGSALWLLGTGSAVTAVDGRGNRERARLDGDFEGVTWLGAEVYLLSSRGLLFRAPLEELSGAAPALAEPLTPLPSGVEGRCNFEGIAAQPAEGALVLACKYPRKPTAGTVLLFTVMPGNHRSGTPEARPLLVDVSPVLDATGFERLRPSGLAWLPEARRLLLLAGKERVILELDAGGTLLAWRRLRWGLHRQAEGLAVSVDGTIAIADEGDGARGTLTLYRPIIDALPGRPGT